MYTQIMFDCAVHSPDVRVTEGVGSDNSVCFHLNIRHSVAKFYFIAECQEIIVIIIIIIHSIIKFTVHSTAQQARQ